MQDPRDISESSRHQSTGLGTRNANVTEIDASVQRNAAMTEQAIQLSEAVGVFILSGAASKARAGAEPAFAHIGQKKMERVALTSAQR